MNVVQEATNVFHKFTKELSDSPTTLRVFLINGTDTPLVACEEPTAKHGAKIVRDFTRLEPGHANFLHFASQAELGGHAAFQLGNERLLVAGELTANFGAGFAAELVEEQGHTASSLYRALPPEFMGLDGSPSVTTGEAFAFVVLHAEAPTAEGRVPVRSPMMRSQATAAMLNEPEQDPSHFRAAVHLLVVRRQEADGWPSLLRKLESSCQVRMADWSRGKPELPAAAFVMELAAIRAGLFRLELRDRVFLLALLMSAFVGTGTLGSLGGGVEAALQRWRAQLPPALVGHESDYDAVIKVEATAAELEAFGDEAYLVLESAALACAPQLVAAFDAHPPQDWIPSEIAETPPKPKCASCRCLPRTKKSNGARHSSSMNSEVSAGSATARLSPFGRSSVGRDMVEMGKRRTKTTKRGDNMKGLVSKVVMETASFSTVRQTVLKAVCEAAPSEEAKTSLRRYVDQAQGIRQLIADTLFGGVCFETWGFEAYERLEGGRRTNHAALVESLGPKAPPMKELTTNSKSGEFFFLSYDRRFLVKTLSEPEGCMLYSMMPMFQRHLQRTPRSLICRHAGLFRVEVPGEGWQVFTIMSSIFDPTCPCSATFDIKGSTFKRKKKDGESVAKDKDWVSNSSQIDVAPGVRKELRAVHEQDAVFLKHFNVMDYSVLLGIHDVKSTETSKADPSVGWRDPVGFWSQGGDKMYFMGIIDFLIRYDLKKTAEHLVRVVQGHGQDASCVNPLDYARRQVAFMRDKVLSTSPEAAIVGTYGTLRVRVINARNLVDSDLLNLSDPYVKVVLGLQTACTHVISNDLNPNWNHDVDLIVDVPHLDCPIWFQVYDKDNAALQGSDDPLGSARVPLRRVVQEGPLEETTPLSGVKSGEITYRLELVTELPAMANELSV